MYCSACGQPMDVSQTNCQRCGRQSAPMGSYAPVAYPRNRVHRHMQTVAILWIAYSLWILLHWAIAVPLGAHKPWFRWTLRIAIFPRDLARAPHHCRSGGSGYPLSGDRNQPAATRILGAYARHRNCVSRPHSPIYRNYIRHLYAVGTLALRFRAGVRPDACEIEWSDGTGTLRKPGC
jgi:hypothetical protein